MNGSKTWPMKTDADAEESRENDDSVDCGVTSRKRITRAEMNCHLD